MSKILIEQDTISQAISDFGGIRSAIIEKGVEIPSLTPTSAYGNKILEIPTGGPVEQDVNFYDYDGTLIASYTVTEARALTALPVPPNHDRLTFQGWNWSLTDINTLNGSANIGAMYVTKSESTELDITVNAITGLSVTIRLQILTGFYNFTMDWGDGTVETSMPTTGAVSWTHEYSASGDYTISFDHAVPYRLYGYSSLPYNIFNVSPSFICTEARLGARCTMIGNYAFYNCYGLTKISLPNTLVYNGILGYAFQNCYRLKSITVPSSITMFNYSSIFRSCPSLRSIALPNSITSVGGDYIFYDAFGLERVTIPSSVTSIAGGAFGNAHNVRNYFMLRASPPTLSATFVFPNINAMCKIFVPKGSLSAYKTATNWTVYALYMVEMEE